ncbi:hypothetical protein CLV31_10677 [Algoriphagus aquaeductus]|uniref:Outer membrane protein with beta-barrel domain n=2 Tax=Cyclobacteriaceae TaxID=563798 RepID=A0A326RRC3_9BACT|nr:hypothetical protein CLV31_10677 [Algoriphagus aquaeductus]
MDAVTAFKTGLQSIGIMKHRLLFVGAIIGFFFWSEARAQFQMRDYNTMVGVRAGTSLGGSVKRFVTDHSAVELMAFNRWKGWNAVLLYEHHMDIREFRGMEWYLGGGAHYGIWKEPKAEPPWVYKGTDDYKAYGIDFIAGLEYNFYNTNIYLSFDWKPAYNFVDFTKLWWDEASFTLRYSF